MGKILEILKNLFEIELLYFNDFLNEKENTFNFNENEIKFMKKYEEINVKYEGQIVGRKRDAAKPK